MGGCWVAAGWGGAGGICARLEMLVSINLDKFCVFCL